MNTSNKNRRVVITGLGAVTSIGIGWQEFWNSLLAGMCGISKVEAFDISDYDRKIAGEIKNFNPQEFSKSKRFRLMGRASQFACAATQMAIDDAGLKDFYEAGIFVGTTMGESKILEVMNKFLVDEEFDKVKESMISTYPANSISENIAREFSLRGRNKLFSNACASGNFSVAEGYNTIRKGQSNVIFAGGSDAISKVAYTGFHRMITIAPEKCQPFDKNRKGMVPGEGAGILVLEEYERAKRRGAKIYAEVLGYGIASDASHMTQPHFRGGRQAILKALENAGIKPEEVDYISAHGTGTPENDKTECEVFYDIFGERIKDIPASSIKSMLGHTMGAASALEAIVCCLAIKEGKIPPTINYETFDSECDIDCVPNKYREHTVKIALNNSLAFGGNDGCVIFKKNKFYNKG